jgi:Ring finger domain
MNLFTHYGNRGSNRSSTDDYSVPPPSLYSDEEFTHSSQFVRAILIMVIVVAVFMTAYILLVLMNRFCCCCCPTWLKPSEFFVAELSVQQQLQHDGDSSDDDDDDSSDSNVDHVDVEAVAYSTTTIRSREATIAQNSNSSTRRDDPSWTDHARRRGRANFSPEGLLEVLESTTRRSTTIASLRRREDHPSSYDLTLQSSLSLVDLNRLHALAQIQATHHYTSSYNRRNREDDDDDDEWQEAPFHFSNLTLFERKTLLQFVLGKSVYIHHPIKQLPPQPHPRDVEKQPKTDAKSHVVASTRSSSSTSSTEQTSDENSQQDPDPVSTSQENDTDCMQSDDDVSKIKEPPEDVVDGIVLKECINEDAVVSNTTIYGADDDYGICGICLTDYDPGVPILSSPHCQHAFHYHCIMDWLSQASSKQAQFDDYHRHRTNAVGLASSSSACSCCCPCPFCRREMVTLPELKHAAHQIMNPNRLAQLGILPKVPRKSRMATTTALPTPAVPPPSTTTTTASSTPASSP